MKLSLDTIRSITVGAVRIHEETDGTDSVGPVSKRKGSRKNSGKNCRKV